MFCFCCGWLITRHRLLSAARMRSPVCSRTVVLLLGRKSWGIAALLWHHYYYYNTRVVPWPSLTIQMVVFNARLRPKLPLEMPDFFLRLSLTTKAGMSRTATLTPISDCNGSASKTNYTTTTKRPSNSNGWKSWLGKVTRQLQRSFP